MGLVQGLLEKIAWLENHPKVQVFEKEIGEPVDPVLLASCEGKLEAKMLDFYSAMNGLKFVWGFKKEAKPEGQIYLQSLEELKKPADYNSKQLEAYLRANFKTINSIIYEKMASFYLLEELPDVCCTLFVHHKMLDRYDFLLVHKIDQEEDRVVAHSFEEYLEKAIENAFIFEWQTESSEIHLHLQRFSKEEEQLDKSYEKILELLNSKLEPNVKLAFTLLEGLGLPFNIPFNEELVKWQNRVVLCLEHGFIHLLHPFKHNFSRLNKLPETINRLPELEELGLNNCNLTDLPESLGELQNLKKLYLSNNIFTEFPRVLGNLKNLEILRIANNLIRNLPSEIEQMTNLKELNLSRNEIEDFGPHLWNLKQLESLNLRGMHLGSLPSELTKLKQLQVLTLYNNFLEELPDFMGDLQNLEELNLYQNKLKDLPPSFALLKKLKVLFLQGNRFVEFPEIICQLKALTYLDIGYSLLTKIPESIANLKNLRYLNIERTYIKELPDSLSEMPQLKFVRVNNIIRPNLEKFSFKTRFRNSSIQFI